MDGGTETRAGSVCALRVSDSPPRSQFVLRGRRVASRRTNRSVTTPGHVVQPVYSARVSVCASVCITIVHLCAPRLCRCVRVQCAPLWNARLACATGTARYSVISAVVTPGTFSVTRRVGCRGLSRKEFQVEPR